MAYELYAQFIANGLIAGGLYALVALGYTMVYGVLKFINFAHGDVCMLSAYFVLVLLGLGFPLWAAALLAIPFGALAGLVIERVAYRPLRTAHRLAPLITSIGVAIFLQAIALLLFGPDVRSIRTWPSEQTIQILGASVTQTQLLIFAVTLAVLVLLLAFLRFTRLGKAARAVSDDREVAALLGVNPDRTIALVFAVGSGIGALGGVMFALDQNLSPTLGTWIGINAFSSAVVGGIGSVPGAMLGGFLVGVLENVGVIWLPSGYKAAIAFALMVLTLLIKPTGLLGAKAEEEVRG